MDDEFKNESEGVEEPGEDEIEEGEEEDLDLDADTDDEDEIESMDDHDDL